MTDAKYKVLIHGAGWVSGEHIRAFRNHPLCDVVAVSSRTASGARRKAGETGLEDVGIYDDYGKALRHEGVNVVAVCTPQHLHCENVVAAAQAGKHIVIEKPVANSLEELRTMRDSSICLSRPRWLGQPLIQISTWNHSKPPTPSSGETPSTAC